MYLKQLPKLLKRLYKVPLSVTVLCVRCRPGVFYSKVAIGTLCKIHEADESDAGVAYEGKPEGLLVLVCAH